MDAPAAAPYPVLYSFRRCPYAMRARLALAASRTVCEWREVVLAHKPEAMLQASPKGTVPVLVLADGAVLEQSLDIMLWALRHNDPQQWLPATGQDLADAQLLISQCDGDFKKQLDRYKYPNRYALPDGLAHQALGAQFLQSLDTRLAAQAFLHGPHFGLADAAVAPFVRQFAHTDMRWFDSQPWPALRQWLAAFEASDRYACVMDKVPAWAEGQTPLLFNGAGD
ncbi:MAG: glutathione S-transferase [Pseudomonadota bacterium]